MDRRLLAFLPCALFCAARPGLAQLRLPGEPASTRHALPGEIPLVVLSSGVALRAADAEREQWPFRYGAEIEVKAGLEDAGRWDRVAETGELVWRLELASPGAFSLGVLFEEFDVPAGAQVFLYSPDRREVLGAYGEHDENPDRRLAIQPLRGERVVIEYDEPPGVAEAPRLVVGAVIHDYRDILAYLSQESELALSCLVDVNCPQAAQHQDVKRAVVWLLGGLGGCSGSILNNTAEDGTPYLLTAQHCGDMTNAVIVFAYERTGCGSGSASQSKTLSGATLLASTTLYDGQLYRLNQTPPSSYTPFYAGWSLATDQHGPVAGISHPGGMPKKIQIDRDDPFLTSSRWSVVNDVGMIQPGSSGSPLFDVARRVIGMLSTGSNPCGSNFANYGRFDRFYATSHLAAWLDPAGWGLDALDGYDPFAPYATPYRGDGLNPSLYSTTSSPRLGTTWTAEIDLAGHPSTTSTIIFGFAAPAQGPVLGFGQLLVDVTSARHVRHGSPASGGLSQHSFALPADPALAGLVSYTQALLMGGGIVATNGLKVILNF